MHYKFNTIELVSIDEFGSNFQIAGTWNNKQFRVDIFCEYDGRDVDSCRLPAPFYTIQCEPTVPGEYDPFLDEVGDDTFFDKLCEDDKFMNLYNAGYKSWELFPKD